MQEKREKEYIAKYLNDNNFNKIYIDEESIDLLNDQDLYSINDEYKIDFTSKLGGGSFGSIYKCYNIKTKSQIAVKIESNSSNTPQLAHEFKVLQALKGERGFSKVYLFQNLGMESILIMDLLGPNLEDIIEITKAKKFSVKTTIMLTLQIIDRLNYLHNRGYIHRDVKPENLVIGNTLTDSNIYLIDFGLSRRYLDNKTGEHIPFKEGKTITGTVRYLSINTHKRLEQSRRDDLISMCYIIIYFIIGKLPWDNVKSKTKEEKYTKILIEKEKYNPQSLSVGLPEEYQLFFEYIFNLKFNEEPNYYFMKSIVQTMMRKLSFWNDLQFDWVKLEMIEVPLYMIKEYKLMKKKKEEEKKQENEKNKEIGENKKKKDGNNNQNNKMKSFNRNNKPKLNLSFKKNSRVMLSSKKTTPSRK